MASARILFASFNLLPLLNKEAYITNADTLSSSVSLRESECIIPLPLLPEEYETVGSTFPPLFDLFPFFVRVTKEEKKGEKERVMKGIEKKRLMMIMIEDYSR